MKVDTTGRTWTYGAEHELADWNATKPGKFGRDIKEVNICNTNGIAADPKLVTYKYGGEVNTPVTNTVQGQVDLFEEFMRLHKNARANWRGGLHIHVGIPGLVDDLPLLKRLQKFILANKEVYRLVDPLPYPTEKSHPEHLKQARKRYAWMCKSHFTTTPLMRVEKQLKARTTKEFFKLEVPVIDDKPIWFLQARACVNIRQLFTTGTIEFRHFPATKNPQQVYWAGKWCKEFLLCGFDKGSALDLYNSQDWGFPKLDTIYNHDQELKYVATCPSLTKKDICIKNIELILKGKFNA